MTQWLINLTVGGGRIALFLTMSGESAARGKLSFVGVVPAASLGNLAGSLVAYWLTKRFGERFLLGPGRRVGINRGHIRLANRFFNKYGVWAVFLRRLLPQ